MGKSNTIFCLEFDFCNGYISTLHQRLHCWHGNPEDTCMALITWYSSSVPLVVHANALIKRKLDREGVTVPNCSNNCPGETKYSCKANWLASLSTENDVDSGLIWGPAIERIEVSYLCHTRYLIASQYPC